MLTPKIAKWILWGVWAIGMSMIIFPHPTDLTLIKVFIAANSIAGACMMTHWFWKKTGIIKGE